MNGHLSGCAEPSSVRKQPRISAPCLSVLRLVFLAGILLLAPGIVSVEASGQATLDVVVTFDGKDVSRDAQVMVMSMPPIVASAGQEKAIVVPAGTYRIMVVLQTDDRVAMPAEKQATLAAGERLTMAVELEPMPGFARPGETPPAPERRPRRDFRPARADLAELEEALVSDDAGRRRDASTELGRRGRDSIDVIVRYLDHSRDDVREEAHYAFLQMTSLREKGPTAADRFIEAIVPALDDPHAPVRALAGRSIGQVPRFPGSAVPLLLKNLGDPDVSVRTGAALGLGRARGHSEEAAGPLAERVIEDDAVAVRSASLESLGGIGARGAAVAEAFRHALNDPDRSVRLAAVRAVNDSTLSAGERASIAARGLSDADVEIRRAAARNLSRLDDGLSRVMPEMTSALGDSDARVRRSVLNALARLSPEELAPAVPSLADSLGDGEHSVRAAAARTLHAAGLSASPALQALIAALADERYEVSREAARTLAVLGPNAASAVPALTVLLVDESRAARDAVWAASEALTAIGEASIPAMQGLLSGKQPSERARGATVLGRIGPPAHAAVPRLLELVRDESEIDPVRRAAFHAVEHITGKRPEL